jgi:hypothetical protein
LIVRLFHKQLGDDTEVGIVAASTIAGSCMTYLLLLSGSGRSQAGPVKDVHAKAQGQSTQPSSCKKANMLFARVRGLQIKPLTAFMDAAVCCFDSSACSNPFCGKAVVMQNSLQSNMHTQTNQYELRGEHDIGRTECFGS